MSGSTFLQIPSTPLARPATEETLLPESTPSFILDSKHKSYKHQYANIYFVRLRLLRGVVEGRAGERWRDIAGAPVLVPRVLEVVKSQLCYIVGTVYLDMPLKPNVLEDIGRDHSIPAPPPRAKFYSPDDAVMLEDESGRIQLVGERLAKTPLVTGVIMAVLGLETSTGEFEVVDMCFAGMAPQANTMPVQATNDMDVDVSDALSGPSGSKDVEEGEWIGLISGLDLGSPSPSDAQIQMLVEYLTSEVGGHSDQRLSSRISRLIIAGNSFTPGGVPLPVNAVEIVEKKPRRYGYDSTTFSPHATDTLGTYLLDIARVMPVHLLAGATDPSGTLLPQQPLPRAMFGEAKDYETFMCETNPTWLGVGARSMLVNSGQPLTDMFKYLPSPPASRLGLAASTLQWRHTAPTAPDTLWCYPYFSADPFVLDATPDVYVIGNQPRFQTRLVVEGDVKCRVVLVPAFAETGTLVLVNLATLDVRTVEFAVEGMSAGGENDK